MNFTQLKKEQRVFQFGIPFLKYLYNSTSLNFRRDRVRANSDVHGIEPFPTSLMMSRARCKMPKPSASFASKQSIQLDPCLLSNHLERRNRKVIQINTWYSTGCLQQTSSQVVNLPYQLIELSTTRNVQSHFSSGRERVALIATKVESLQLSVHF